MLEQHKVDRATVSRKPTLTNVDTIDDPLSYVDIGPHDDDPPDPKAIFEQFTFEVILEKVHRQLALLVKQTFPNTLTLELDDIAIEIHFHFWQVLEDKEREPIRYPVAYLAKMIHHRLCDEIRKRNRHGSPQPFSMLSSGAFQEVNAMASANSGMSDPAFEYERKQHGAQFLHKLAYAVSKLPPRQKLAMTCELLEEVDNLAWMSDALILYGVDTEVQWPADKKAKQRLQANLPAARLAVAECLHIDIATLPKKRRSR